MLLGLNDDGRACSHLFVAISAGEFNGINIAHLHQRPLSN